MCLDAPRLGVLGGSFDPVHAGHLGAARLARRAFELDHVVFVPAARPPHKPGCRLAAGEHRLAMLARALRGEPGTSSWDVELRREGPSFTVDTLRELVRRRGHPGGLHLIVGRDNLAGLPSWREVEEVLALAQPVVVQRGGDPAALERALARLEGRLSGAALARLQAGLVREAPPAVAATELRSRLARGEDPGADLPPGVWEYARSRGIYGGAP